MCENSFSHMSSRHLSTYHCRSAMIILIKSKKALIKKLKSVGMTLKKGKKQDGMMLAKVKEQDGIMLANVKVPSIPTSAACCDNVQLTNAESSSYTFTTVNYYLIGLRPPNTATCSIFTTVNYFIGLRPPKHRHL